MNIGGLIWFSGWNMRSMRQKAATRNFSKQNKTKQKYRDDTIYTYDCVICIA